MVFVTIMVSEASICPDKKTPCNGCQYCPGNQGLCPSCDTSKLPSGITCTNEGVDPFKTGKNVPCCPGLNKCSANYNNNFAGNFGSYVCTSNKCSCTAPKNDTYASGHYVPCCSGTTSCLKDWVKGTFSFRCVDASIVTDCRNAPCAVGNKGTCTLKNGDNYCTGKHLPCCEGYVSCLKEWYPGSKNYYFKCVSPSDAQNCLNPITTIPYSFIGDFKDSQNSRAFSKQVSGSSFTPATCYQQAKALNYVYFGLQYGGECR